MLYEILAIDVWGDSEDGYEINDQHGTGIIVEIPEGSSDADALRAIRRALGHPARARGYHNPHQDPTSYRFYRNDSGRPAYYARRVS